MEPAQDSDTQSEQKTDAEPMVMPQNTEVKKPPSRLTTVTPLSKYLALALFIVLPFIGGWIGYQYAPEKVVEVEQVILTEEYSGEYELDIAKSKTLRGEFAFVSYQKRGWSGAWIVNRENADSPWLKYEQLARKYITEPGILSNSQIHLFVSGAFGNDETWSPALVTVSTKDFSTKEITLETNPINHLRVEDEIYIYNIESAVCLDIPRLNPIESREDCAGSISVINEDGELTFPAVFDNLPSAKQLVAYDKEKDSIILSSGYADGGCVWSEFYEYNFGSQEIELLFDSSGCGDEIEQHNIAFADFERQIIDTYPYHIFGRESFSTMTFKNGDWEYGSVENLREGDKNFTQIYLESDDKD